MAKARKRKSAPAGRANRAVGGRVSSEQSTEARPAWLQGVSWEGLVAVCLACLLVVMQGGFYPGATCALGAVAAIGFLPWMLVRWRAAKRNQVDSASVGFGKSFAWQVLAFALIALVYLASALAHVTSASMLEEAASWFAVAGLALWCVPQTSRQKRVTLDALASVGAVLAAVGIVMYAGLLPVEGAVNVGRLMFTFQYANTAGIFFAVVAVLCLSAPQLPRKALAILPIAALCLTKSGGAIAVFAVGVVALFVRWLYEERPEPRVIAVVVACGAAFALAAVYVLAGRAEQAIQTLTERFIQMGDALSLLGANPIFGIGPDQWQFAYSFVQTAQYGAADVHNSYLQIGLDAGLVALALFIAFLVVGFARLVRARDFTSFLCVGMIALHALIDFDFQFSSMLVIVSLLFVTPPSTRPVASRAQERFPFRVAVVALACCTAIGSGMGVWLDVRSGEMRQALLQEGAAEVASSLDQQPLLANDALMRVHVASALYQAGSYQEVIDFIDRSDPLPYLPENVELYRAFSLYRVGSGAQACEALGSTLIAHPYNVELYRAVREFIADEEPGEEFIARFNDAASYANSLAESGNALLLSNQMRIELL